MYGFSASANRRLSRRADLSAFGSWQRSDRGAGDEETLWSVDVLGSYRLNQDVSTSFGYRHERNDSDVPANDYTENRLTARVNVTF